MRPQPHLPEPHSYVLHGSEASLCLCVVHICAFYEEKLEFEERGISLFLAAFQTVIPSLIVASSIWQMQAVAGNYPF